MALAVSFTFTIQDNKKRPSTTKVRVPNGFSIAQYLEFGQAMAQLIANASNGKVVSASANLTLDLSSATIRSATMITADIFEKAIIVVRSAVTGLYAKFFPPTLNDTYVVDGSGSLDQTQTAVSDYLTILTGGIDVGGAVIVAPTDKRGNDLVSVKSAEELFRKS